MNWWGLWDPSPRIYYVIYCEVGVCDGKVSHWRSSDVVICQAIAERPLRGHLHVVSPMHISISIGIRKLYEYTSRLAHTTGGPDAMQALIRLGEPCRVA